MRSFNRITIAKAKDPANFIQTELLEYLLGSREAFRQGSNNACWFSGADLMQGIIKRKSNKKKQSDRRVYQTAGPRLTMKGKRQDYSYNPSHKYSSKANPWN